jgi:hypothetical protein
VKLETPSEVSVTNRRDRTFLGVVAFLEARFHLVNRTVSMTLSTELGSALDATEVLLSTSTRLS